VSESRGCLAKSGAAPRCPALRRKWVAHKTRRSACSGTDMPLVTCVIALHVAAEVVDSSGYGAPLSGGFSKPDAGPPRPGQAGLLTFGWPPGGGL